MTTGLLVILMFFNLSCKNSFNHYRFEQDCQKLYSLALNQTTGSDTIFRYHTGIPQKTLNKNPLVTKKYVKHYEERRDSIIALLDTVKIFVVVNHKIEILPNDVTKYINKKINNNNFKLSNNSDISYNNALKALCNNQLNIDTIKVSDLRTKYNYKIYSDRSYPNNRIRNFGTISFSKIGFSDNHKKAVIYTSFICGFLCGRGQILFFEKMNGVWKYVKSWHIWVS